MTANGYVFLGEMKMLSAGFSGLFTVPVRSFDYYTHLIYSFDTITQLFHMVKSLQESSDSMAVSFGMATLYY